MNVRVISLQKIDIFTVTQLFNKSFEGYVVPVRLTHQQMKDRNEKERIDLLASFALEIDGQLAGICLNGVIGTNAYCGGFAVFREYRGKGYGKNFFLENMVSLKEKGVQEYQLEVLNENVAALLLYKGLGFEITDEVFVLEGQFSTLAPKSTKKATIVSCSYDEMISHCSFDDLTRVWSCSPRILTDTTNVQSFIIRGKEIWGGGVYSSKEEIWVLRDLRVNNLYACDFFEALPQVFGEKKCSFYYAHKRSPITDVFLQRGWNVIYRQFALNRTL